MQVCLHAGGQSNLLCKLLCPAAAGCLACMRAAGGAQRAQPGLSSPAPLRASYHCRGVQKVHTNQAAGVCRLAEQSQATGGGLGYGLRAISGDEIVPAVRSLTGAAPKGLL